MCLHHFAGHVEQDRNHRRVIIAVDDEAHLLQSGPEVSGVLCQLANPFNACDEQKKREEKAPDVHE